MYVRYEKYLLETSKNPNTTDEFVRENNTAQISRVKLHYSRKGHEDDIKSL